MKGSIRQRSKGSWEVCVDIGRDPTTGRRLRHFESIKGPKRLAQQRLAELLVSIERGSYVKPKRVTLGQWLESWLDSYVKIHCSLRTKESYESEIQRHILPNLGQIPLSQLQPQHIQGYYAQALTVGRVNRRGGLSARTVEYHHRILSEALNHAVKMGFLVRNVAEAVEPPHPGHKDMVTLAAKDIPRFLRSARETPYYTLYCVTLFTGMRLGELLGLRWSDVDLNLASLSVVQALYKRCGVCKMIEPKSAHSRRQIALSPSLVLLLHQYKAKQEVERILLGKPLNDSDLVFAHTDGSPLDPGTVTHTFTNVLCKAGLPHIRFHDLRHTHATLMLKAGVHPKVVQERLGHASISITLDTYSHVLPGLQEAAAQRFEGLVDKEALEMLVSDQMPKQNVGKMSAKGLDGSQKLAKKAEFKCEPPGTRTLNRLIKSQLLFQLS